MLVVFLCIKNELSKKVIQKTVSFITASKQLTFLCWFCYSTTLLNCLLVITVFFFFLVLRISFIEGNSICKQIILLHSLSIFHFFGLISLARTSSTILKSRVDNRHLFLIPNPKRKHSVWMNEESIYDWIWC